MRFLLLFFPLMLFCAGCQTQNGTTSQTQTAAEWLRPWESEGGYSDLRQLDRSEFAPVTAAQWDKTKALLEEVSIVPISRAQAQLFAGKKFDEPGKKPFLVRAVLFPSKEGEWTVFHLKTKLVTDNIAFGPRKNPLKKGALVVFLPNQPTDIYVDCTFIKVG